MTPDRRRLRRIDRLAIEANDLLRARDDPSLARRGTPFDDDDTRGLDAEILQEIEHACACAIAAHDGAEAAVGAKRDHVAHDVAGAPEHLGFSGSVDYRNPGPRADTIDVADEILIERDVADDSATGSVRKRSRWLPGAGGRAGPLRHVPGSQRPLKRSSRSPADVREVRRRHQSLGRRAAPQVPGQYWHDPATARDRAPTATPPDQRAPERDHALHETDRHHQRGGVRGP